MNDHTYIPATGQIFMEKGIELMPDRSNRWLVGTAPPMIAGRTGNGIDVNMVSRLAKGNPVPVMEILSEHNAPYPDGDPTKNRDVKHCHDLMLLPALLQYAAYPNLHYAFSEIPLVHTHSEHPLPDSCKQAGPFDAHDIMNIKASSTLYAEFDAKGYCIYIHQSVDDFYSTLTNLDMARLQGILEEREIKHEQEAFEALDSIDQKVVLHGIDDVKGGRTSAMKLSEIISTTRSMYGSRITHVVMGAGMYQRYLTGSRIQGAPVPGASTDIPGLGPLPGLEYVTVIINPMMDRRAPDTIYAVDRHSGAFYGQGPIVLERYDEDNGNGTKFTEYYQYMITDNYAKRVYEDLSKRRTALKIIAA